LEDVARQIADRNKVAHWGEAAFRDDQNKLHRVDRAMLEQWWKSVDQLLN
jgi:hypothetical protein